MALLPTPLGTHKDTLYRSRAADAASDVWEPILANLVGAILLYEDGMDPHWPPYQKFRKAMDEAKEALDG